MRNDRPVGRLRALGALVLLLAVVAGAPAAILAVFGWPLTRGMLDVRRWPDALTATEVSDDAIVRVFVTLALVLLAYLLGCAVSEVVALARRTERRTRSHNPLSYWIRHLVAVSSVLLSTARPAASLPSVGPAAASAAVTAVVSAAPTPGVLRGLPTPSEGLAVVGDRVVDARDARPGTMAVEAGRRDSLYSLAVRHLGDGERRDELLALNQGRTMPDGTTFDGTVRPGYTILVPTAAASVDEVAAPPAESVERTYTVQPGDSLWSIAERELGDGASYVHLHEANLGREVAPGVAYLSTTSVIRPGWVLVVPDPASAPAAEVTPGSVHVVRPGESVWSIAEQATTADDGTPAAGADVADYVERTVEANEARFVRPGHPELILPGQELVLPAPAATDGPAADTGPGPVDPTELGASLPAPAPMPPPLPPPVTSAPVVAPPVVDRPAVAPSAVAPSAAAPSTVAAPTTTARPDPIVASAADGEATTGAAVDDDQQDDRSGPSLPGLAGAAVLAAGALGAVLRLRHQRLNRRRPGTRIEAPDDDVALVERVLRAQADLELARWAPSALRQLAPRLGTEWDGSYPMVAEVTLRPVGVTIAWTSPRPTPVAPWRIVGDGSAWELDRAPGAPEPEVADGVVPPCPGLVTIGRRDGATVLVDVESAGMVSVRGEAEQVAAFGRAAVLELAVTDFADLLDIRLVGLPGDGFEHLGRVHAVPALDQALAWARPLRLSTDELLAEEGVDSLFELRSRQGANAVTHEPLVLVVAAGLLDDAGAAELRRLCRPGRGIVAVVLGDVPAPVQVSLSPDGSAAVERPGDDRVGASSVDGVPALPEPTLDAVGALLAHAADAAERVLPTPLPVRRSEAFAEPAAAMEVRLLGPVGLGPVGGDDLADVPARTMELIAWLATHGPNQPGGRVRADLWGGREGATRSLNHHAVAARALLGADAAGRVLFPPPVEDRYGLSDAVVTDVERLERRLRWSTSGAADEAAVEVLREGLSLVRGRPFTVRSGYAWAFADQVVFGAEQLVVDAAHRLGTLALALDDPAGAVWASGVGLLGRPGDETLYQLRMRAFARVGNRSSVRQAMNQLCSELQDLAGVDEPSDETTELFEKLMGRERSA